MAPEEESFEIVDPSGTVIGTARRSELHRNPSLIHRVVHILIFSPAGALLLQKRSMAKDTAPGKWDTSVGGHVDIGEDSHSAALREMREELGIDHGDLTHLYDHLFRNSRETELVSTFTCTHAGPFPINPAEIDEVRFWEMARIRAELESGIFSGSFQQEFRKYEEFLG